MQLLLHLCISFFVCISVINKELEISSYPAGIMRLRLIKNFTKMSKWNFLFTYFCEVPRERYNFTFTSFWGVNVKLYKMDRLIEL